MLVYVIRGKEINKCFSCVDLKRLRIHSLEILAVWRHLAIGLVVSLIVIVFDTIFLHSLVVNTVMVPLVFVTGQFEARVIMVMVISPAGLLLMMAHRPLTSVVHFCIPVMITQYIVVSKFMSFLQISLMLIFDSVLMGVFFFKSAAQILLEFFFFSDVALMRLQVR